MEDEKDMDNRVMNEEWQYDRHPNIQNENWGIWGLGDENKNMKG